LNQEKNVVGDKKPKAAVFDCNVWLYLLSAKDARLNQKIGKDGYPVVITSYGVVEILRALKRLSKNVGAGYASLEEDFWDLCNSTTVQKEFNSVISGSLIGEVHRNAEFRLIAKLLGLEVKDVPYVVAAFQFDAMLVTKDERSIISKQDIIKRLLDLDVVSLNDFLKEP
jgi:predicted nucleic acid-binding protein